MSERGFNLLGKIPAEEETKVQVASVVNVSLLVNADNAGAKCEDFVKDVVQDDIAQRNAGGVGNALDLITIWRWQSVGDWAKVVVDDIDQLLELGAPLEDEGLEVVDQIAQLKSAERLSI